MFVVTAFAAATSPRNTRARTGARGRSENALPRQDESQQEHDCHLDRARCHVLRLVAVNRQSLRRLPRFTLHGNISFADLVQRPDGAFGRTWIAPEAQRTAQFLRTPQVSMDLP